MKILVTGGAGFIGSNLVKRLIEDGVPHVAVIDDYSTGRASNLRGLDVEVFKGSILDQTLLSEATKGAHGIVHLAARPSVPRSIEDPVASHHANATGTINVLQAARECNAHVSVASSSSVYGTNPSLPKTEDLRPMPISPYAVSKLTAEAYALSFQAVYGLPVLPFRLFNVYGPGQTAAHAYAAAVPTFIDAAMNDRPIPIFGDGFQTRDFTFVDTVTSALSRATRERVTSNDAVNLAFGTRHSLLDVVEILEGFLNRPLKRDHLAVRAGDVRDSQADNARLLGLFPELTPTPLAEGIRRTVQWFQQ